MNEPERIKSLFEKLYQGPNWIDVDILSVLSRLNAEQAAVRKLPKSNTIWEIVVHMIRWRENVLQRVQGELPMTPDNNYFEKVTGPSEDAWARTLKELQRSQEKWEHYLSHLKVEELNKLYAPNNMDHYEHIQGIIQHDAYHLGQIVLLSKYA